MVQNRTEQRESRNSKKVFWKDLVLNLILNLDMKSESPEQNRTENKDSKKGVFWKRFSSGGTWF